MSKKQNLDFECDVHNLCHEAFNNPYDLETHIIKEHPDTKQGLDRRLKRIEQALSNHRLMELP